MYFVYTVDANTTTNNASLVRVVEGFSVTLSCTSTGAPTPAIEWLLDDLPVPFAPINVVMESSGTLSRVYRNSLEFVTEITLGSIVSALNIMSARYPADNGIYTCVGSNDELMLNTSAAMITLQVIGKIGQDSFCCLEIVSSQFQFLLRYLC